MSQPTSTDSGSVPRRHLAIRLTAHATALLAVMLVPVWLYEWMESLSLHGHRALGQFSRFGGLTYPLYACYWTLKIRNRYVRYSSMQIVVLVSCSFFFSELHAFERSLVWLALPTLLASICLLASIAAGLAGRAAQAKALLLAWVLSIPVFIALTALLFQGLALSAMSGLRY